MVKNPTFLIALFIFLGGFVFAQDLRKKAEENPLDCAFYLLTKDNESITGERLADAFFDAGRYGDSLRAIDLERSGTKQSWLVYRLSLLIENGNRAQANQFLDKIFQTARAENGNLNHSIEYLAPSFIKLNRTEEALSLIDFAEDDEFKVSIKLARAFLEANQPDNALKVLPASFEMAETEQKAEIIELYARLKQTEKAGKLLAEFEPAAFIEEGTNRRLILFLVINTNLALGKVEHALELRGQYGEQDDFFLTIKVIDSLIEFGYREKANAYLQIETNPEMLKDSGSDIVERHLKLENTETALNIAKTMADNNDSYQQQKALMIVADKFISDGKNDSALDVLDFAFQRAGKIVFEHEPYQSNGASSGTRKRMYLGNIYRRLMKLKQFDKAFTTFNSIGSDHWIAKEFTAESLFDFTKQQIKTLPRRKIYEILTRLQTIFTEDEDYYPIRSRLLAAEIYALIGEKAKAVELLTKVLEMAKESCCYKDDFLFSTGKIFEEHKLKADAGLKKILREILKVAEQ